MERQVQERLAAEHQADAQKQLDQREADLNARENALTAREDTPTPEPQATAAPNDEKANVPAPDASENYGTFYTRLDPYGSWIDTGTYGYVWQPQAAERSRSWRPYTNGRWVFTDAGWTWYSEEPFGWATYHYGRWTRLRSVGWVWVPGEEWAPAWVSWREGDGYVGWAPLPPEARFERGTGIHHWADNYYDIGPEQYTFVPTRDLGDRAGRDDMPDRFEHSAVRGEDMGEAQEILGADLPRAACGYVQAVTLGGGEGAGIGRLAGMVGGGRRRVHFEVQPGTLRSPSQGGFGEGRADDVAEADEQDGGQNGRLHGRQTIIRSDRSRRA